tara:strand:- start:399 stop:530 length:132 start_codon:yes stop_codon:yes gene_type:complete
LLVGHAIFSKSKQGYDIHFLEEKTWKNQFVSEQFSRASVYFPN